MTDESVHAALRSNQSLVVIEAPGGCGKTHQAAGYAREIAMMDEPGRLLILTHTHAACSVFDQRTRDLSRRVEIKTIDSVIARVTSAYHAGLGLPVDTTTWARTNRDGYDWLAVHAAALLKRYPAIARAIACRYPTIICDEHQDSTGERHAFIMALLEQGSKLRIFADPMQAVFRPKRYVGGALPLDWTELTEEAGQFEQLGTPHRWAGGSRELGRWVLEAREALKNGGVVDLRDVPESVTVVRAGNQARRNLEYWPIQVQRGPIDAFVGTDNTLMVLTRHNAAANSLRGAFYRRVQLWEGHTRPALEKYVDALGVGDGDRQAIATAVVDFVQQTSVGFTNAGYANSFRQDVADGCRRARRLKPAKIQALSRMIVDEPDYRGASKVLGAIVRLRGADPDFSDIKIDCVREFHEGLGLGRFVSPAVGFAELSHRRTYTRPSPPTKCISTIHKSKGLECHSVVIAPCDAVAFPNNQLSRCLLYVAMSRPTHRLMLVVPADAPSPLLRP